MMVNLVDGAGIQDYVSLRFTENQRVSVQFCGTLPCILFNSVIQHVPSSAFTIICFFYSWSKGGNFCNISSGRTLGNVKKNYIK